ncbi:hypothetical protein [Priestia megaterium]
MTLVISYVSDTISVIISDRKVSKGKEAEEGFSTDEIKLIPLRNMGWSSGAGHAGFLNYSKEVLSDLFTYQVTDVAKTYTKAMDYCKKIDPENSKWIEESVVVASWRGPGEGGNQRFYIGVLSKEHIKNEMPSLLVDNYIFVLYPNDYLKDLDKVRAIQDKYGYLYEFEDSAEKLFDRLLNIFREIAINSEFVTEYCDIGVYDNHLVGEKKRISGDVSDLIEQNSKGQLFNNLERIN